MHVGAPCQLCCGTCTCAATRSGWRCPLAGLRAYESCQEGAILKDELAVVLAGGQHKVKEAVGDIMAQVSAAAAAAPAAGASAWLNTGTRSAVCACVRERAPALTGLTAGAAAASLAHTAPAAAVLLHLTVDREHSPAEGRGGDGWQAHRE
jgi:hypothetical protein